MPVRLVVQSGVEWEGEGDKLEQIEYGHRIKHKELKMKITNDK